MFYDGSLVLITLVVLAVHGSLNPQRIALLWIAASSQALAHSLGWTPLFFVVLGVALWASLAFGRRLGDRVPPQSSAAAG
jgi:hypothetical protein